MALRRVGDALLDGSAGFTADLPPADALHLAFVTSPVAHARIERVDTTVATGAPGVVAVFTASDLPTVPIHEIALIPESLAQPALADGEVRFVGEYVVAIVAETPAAAADAAELVDIEYSPLPAVTDARASDDVALSWDAPAADGAFADAEVTIRGVVLHPAPRSGTDGGPSDPRGPASREPGRRGSAHVVRVDAGAALDARAAGALARSPVRPAARRSHRTSVADSAGRQSVVFRPT